MAPIGPETISRYDPTLIQSGKTLEMAVDVSRAGFQNFELQVFDKKPEIYSFDRFRWPHAQMTSTWNGLFGVRR